jgi:high affinity sulfate transporter 1
MRGAAGTRSELIARWLPGLHRFRSYQRGWFRSDFIAGMILVALLVPQGMAYAELAGLPPVNGLYASMVPLLIYALLGPSRILVLAPDSAVAPIVAAAVVPIAGADMDERVAIAGLLAVLVGVLCLVGGVAGLGFLTDLISRPVRLGYLAGIALIVVASQLPRMLGLGSAGDSVPQNLRIVVNDWNDVSTISAVLGLASLAGIVTLRRLSPRIPAALIVVAGAMLLNRLAELSLDIVGPLPRGLPEFVMPRPDSGDLSRLALTSVAIALIAFTDTSVLSRSYASRLSDDIDANQELRGLGGANLATGFFQGFPISSSSSRTPVAEQAGSQTQLTGVFAALGLGIVLVVASGLFRDLPMTVLAAILIAAAVNLFDVQEFRRLWRVHRPDCLLALAAVLGVAIAGVLWGVGIAVALSIAAFLWRSWHPYVAVLGRARGVKGYHDLTRYPEAEQVPGLLLLRFDAPIFFANAGLFRECVIDAIRGSPTKVLRVVIAAEPVTDLDSTAADMLTELDRELSAMGVELAFAEMKDPIKDQLTRFAIIEQIGREKFYPTLGVAVRRFVEETGVPWVDWEDEITAASDVIPTSDAALVDP